MAIKTIIGMLDFISSILSNRESFSVQVIRVNDTRSECFSLLGYFSPFRRNCSSVHSLSLSRSVSELSWTRISKNRVNIPRKRLIITKAVKMPVLNAFIMNCLLEEAKNKQTIQTHLTIFFSLLLCLLLLFRSRAAFTQSTACVVTLLAWSCELFSLILCDNERQ